MRIAIGQFHELSDDLLALGRQLGATGVVVNAHLGNREFLPEGRAWEVGDLRRLQEWCARHELKVEAVESFPLSFYEAAMLGLPNRDEQIERCRLSVSALGRAGIRMLGLHWMPSHVWRTMTGPLGRGGARVSAFDMSEVRDEQLTHDCEISSHEMRANLDYFLDALLDTAEASDVQLALHPDDPPVPSLGGIARILTSGELMAQILERHPSSSLGLLFCIGTWSAMGESVTTAIETFGTQGKIFYVHFRDVLGSVPAFRECFPGEGNVNLLAALEALRGSGFDGFLFDDHVPLLEHDSGWGERGRAYCTGYLAATLNAASLRTNV